MEEIFRKCNDEYVNDNLFCLNDDDVVYEYLVNNIIVGYGILRNNEFDMIQIYIDKKYQDNHYGSALFKHMLIEANKQVCVSVEEDNIKIIKIIKNNNAKEIGRNNKIYTYLIEK